MSKLGQLRPSKTRACPAVAWRTNSQHYKTRRPRWLSDGGRTCREAGPEEARPDANTVGDPRLVVGIPAVPDGKVRPRRSGWRRPRTPIRGQNLGAEGAAIGLEGDRAGRYGDARCSQPERKPGKSLPGRLSHEDRRGDQCDRGGCLSDILRLARGCAGQEALAADIGGRDHVRACRPRRTQR